MKWSVFFSDPRLFLFLMVDLVCIGVIVALIIMLVCTKKVFYEKEKYDLIAEQYQEIWFDYQFEPPVVKLSGCLSMLAGTLPSELRGGEIYEVYDWVYEDDTSIRSELRQFFDGGDRYYNTEIRIKNADGTYGWYAVKGTLVKDKFERNERFVVRMENVDHQMSQEKKLVQKAEIDLLTNILNKKTMEERVSVMLEQVSGNLHYVFFMIDLDNFKSVNDTLGHSYGDKVLVDAAEKLKEIFPKSALIGRLGGDEFAVCAEYEAFDEASLQAFVRKKATAIRDSIHAEYYCDDLGVEVSSSIGIAIAPEFGTDFESIYQKADKALYLSKRSGKKCFNIYENSHGTMI